METRKAGCDMNHSHIRIWGTMGVLVCFALGCSALTAAPPTLAPPTPTAMPTSIPSAVPTMITSPEVALCPERRPLAPPQRSSADPSDLDTFVAEVQTYLTEGGDPADVPLLDYETSQRGDLTGTGSQEIVYVLIDTDAEQIVPMVHLIIYTCQAGEMMQLYRYVPPDGSSLELIGVTDLTQDGISDLVFSEFTCGAHTCWHTPYVWTWSGTDFANRMGAEYQFPYPTFELTPAALVVRSVGVGSVGAGPQRPSTTTLAWTGEAVTVTEETLDEPTYRYHAFLDGERAVSEGVYEVARTAYSRTIEDGTLESWGALYGVDEERQWLGVLAQWRKVIVFALQDRFADAQAAFDGIDLTLDAQAPGAPASVLAQRFWQAYQESGEVISACAFAINSDAAQPTLDFLNTFGYANPFFEDQDLCPALNFAGE
jgi:hypothetical protein